MDNQIIIELGNVYSSVSGVTGQMVTSLYNELSCFALNYWFSSAFKNGRWDGKTHFFNRKTKQFPTGLISRVLEILEPYEVAIKMVDKRAMRAFQIPTSTFDAIELSEQKTLRSYQVETVNTVINNTLNGLPFQRGIINIATNGGKTVIAEAIIQQMYPLLEKHDYMLMFVTHSKEIGYQAKKSFEEDLGIPVGFVGDSKFKLEKVTIVLISTLYSRMKRNDDTFKLLKSKAIGFIGDEIHHSSSTSWYEVLEKFDNSIIRLGLTGTINDDDEEKKMRLFSVCGEVLVRISNEFLIKHGFSAVPVCKLVTIDYPDIDRNMRYYGQEGEAGELNYQDVYQKGIVKNDYRNYLIAKICQKEAIENCGQVLVLVEHIEQGVSIQNMLDIINPDINHIFLYGELSSEERQNGLDLLKAGDVDVVVSTAILDEGVDVPNINAVVYARGGKSIRKLLQGIGRGLRKKDDDSPLKFYDFIDDTSKYLLEHSLRRYKTLKKEKFQITKLDLEVDLGYTEQEHLYFMENYDNAFDGDVFVYVSEV